VHVEVEAVEGHEHDDHDRADHRDRPDLRRWRQPADDEGEEPVDDHRPHHVTAWKAVGGPGSGKELADARPVGFGQRCRRREVMQVELVEDLERLRPEKDDEHKRIRAETRAPQIKGKAGHQDARHLDASKLRYRLEEDVQRWPPGIVHRDRDLAVEIGEPPRRDRDRQRDEGNAESDDAVEARR
jgi:hypothetical protein